jgi:NAD(P)H-dependent flavin oxidoreductase YrpB (nitropropane dioxygenase family)
MRTPLTELTGVDFPIVGFSHCRDVVAAVSKSGGLGMLGAVRFSPEELDQELTVLEKETGGRPYGVDLLIPTNLATTDETASADEVPTETVAFVKDLLVRYGVMTESEDIELDAGAVTQYTPDNVEGLLDVAFAHRPAMIASALGVPPAYLIERAKRESIPVAALVGKVSHAQKQQAMGVDVIVAQGHEAGGHAGEITTMVLTPQVVDAVAPIPVLAAGGIASGRQVAAALALGAAGVWCGSVWLTTQEAETHPTVKDKMLHATSADTVRAKVRTGKLARQLRTPWHEAWAAEGAPAPLPMPLMEMLSFPAFRRIARAAEHGNRGARELHSYFVGQVVGMMNQSLPATTVMRTMIEEYADTVVRLEEISES